MKLSLKPISLKKDILNDIDKGEINTEKYVNYIKRCLKYANCIVETKLLSLDGEELYDILSKVFKFELGDTDLLGILSKKYDKNYLNINKIKTTMVDDCGNNIVLVGASTKKVKQDNKVFSLSDIRKIVNSYDFVIIDTLKIKSEEKIKRPDKFENYQFDKTSLIFDRNNESFELISELLEKEIRNRNTLKRVLNLVECYVNELFSQAKAITKLGDNNDELVKIGKEYKKAYDENFKNKNALKKGNHRRSY